MLDVIAEISAILDRVDSVVFLCESWLNDRSQDMSLEKLNELKLSVAGKNGLLADCFKLFSSVDGPNKKSVGSKINHYKQRASYVFKMVHDVVSSCSVSSIDVTLPGRSFFRGAFNPVLDSLYRSLDILSSLGFVVKMGKEIDSEYNVFDSLNFPPYHPARLSQDTFYMSNGEVLRSQTSGAQVYIMKEGNLPIRAVVPGKCFRNEDVTSRSLTVFHQIELLYVDTNVSVPDLIGTLKMFYQRFIGSDVNIRVRPSFFPFVMPGVEVDISCFLCSGNGCFTCKKSGWLEVAGAGMVHPNVLKSGGVDPTVYSGFAAGFGVERLALLLNGVEDIRLFVENKISFLGHFKKFFG